MCLFFRFTGDVEAELLLWVQFLQLRMAEEAVPRKESDAQLLGFVLFWVPLSIFSFVGWLQGVGVEGEMGEKRDVAAAW